MKKKARLVAVQWLRRYRSPIAETVTVNEFPDGFVGWKNGNGGMLLVTERWDDDWPEDIKRWYIARRDAILLGSCPMCNASLPVIVNQPIHQRGNMVHENDCVVSDTGFREVFGTLPAPRRSE